MKVELGSMRSPLGISPCQSAGTKIGSHCLSTDNGSAGRSPRRRAYTVDTGLDNYGRLPVRPGRLSYFFPRRPPRLLPFLAFSGFSALALAADGMPSG